MPKHRTMRQGTRVYALFDADGKWYLGTIKQKKKGKFDVHFDDDTDETNFAPNELVIVPQDTAKSTKGIKRDEIPSGEISTPTKSLSRRQKQISRKALAKNKTKRQSKRKTAKRQSRTVGAPSPKKVKSGQVTTA